MTSSDLSGSRAILIGNGEFADRENIPRVPASGCVAAMADLLTSDLCSWPRDRIDLFEDLPNQADLSRKLVRAVRAAKDVLLVYYVGHGMLTMRGDLVLALRDTEVDPESLPYTAMPYGHLANILHGSTAATKLVILDCCYAETANQANFGTLSAGLTDAYPVDGLYFIGASKRLEKAGFALYGDLTYFTEAFIDTVRTGIPGHPPAPDLSLSDIFRALRDRLAASGLPEPADSGIRDARQYPFAKNAAFSRRTVNPQDPARTARLLLLSHAERAASQIPLRWRGVLGVRRHASALLAVAAAVGADDPDRARRLTSQALRLVAASNVAPSDMVSVVKGLAATSPERAEQIATAISDPQYCDRAMGEVAKATAASNPDQAERVASAISDARMKDSTLADVAGTLKTFAPKRAEHLADTISDPYVRQEILAGIAAAISATDPRRAEAIAVALSGTLGGWHVAEVAASLATVDLEAAERVACSIADQEYRDEALQSIAEVAVSCDPHHALSIVAEIATPRRGWAEYLVAVGCARKVPDLAVEIARAISDPHHRTITLHILALIFAEVGSDRAAQLRDEAEQACRTISDNHYDSDAGLVASALVAADQERALRLAKTVSDPGARADAFSRIAVAVAGTDPYSAEHIAVTISESRKQARTLIDAAEVARRHGCTDGAGRLLEKAKSLMPAVSDLGDRTLLLADMAVELAALDPDHARRTIDEAEIVGRTIPDHPGLDRSKPRNEALRDVAWAAFRSVKVRKVLGDHAERIARAIPSDEEQADVLERMALELFGDDPDRAERVALAITDPELRVAALLALSANVASSS